MNDAYDTIVIGGGHNGLTVAAYLAKAGQRVLVLERREHVGGAAVTEEIYPGFKFDTGAHRIGRLQPEVVRDLQLAKHGLEVLPSDPSVYAPLPDGGGLTLWRDPQKSAEEIGRFSKQDASRYGDFAALIDKATGFLASIYGEPPIDPVSTKTADTMDGLRIAGRLRRLGKHDMMEVLRILPMNMVELMDDWFETDILRGTLGAAGITGIRQGPYSTGTAFLFLHHHVGITTGALRGILRPRGGMGSLSAAFEAAATTNGATIKTGSWVERIDVENGKAIGVTLVSGEKFAARRIVSNSNPRHTYLDLLDPMNLQPAFLHRVRNIRMNGVCARVNLALDALPEFKDAPAGDAHLRGAISISPSLNYLEKAYDNAKHGELSEKPYIEAVIPSLSDPTLAPDGKHVMSILVQYAPFDLKEGVWDDANRAKLGDLTLETLAEFAPNIESIVEHAHVLTPLDIEGMFGLAEGNIYHGEMTLDQIYFMRPVPGWAQYRAPVENLYLCSAGTHPGGGVTAANGYNAAQVILEDSKKKK
jgi:phytoene dehydrogenase-like protein